MNHLTKTKKKFFALILGNGRWDLNTRNLINERMSRLLSVFLLYITWVSECVKLENFPQNHFRTMFFRWILSSIYFSFFSFFFFNSKKKKLHQFDSVAITDFSHYFWSHCSYLCVKGYQKKNVYKNAPKYRTIRIIVDCNFVRNWFNSNEFMKVRNWIKSIYK